MINIYWVLMLLLTFLAYLDQDKFIKRNYNNRQYTIYTFFLLLIFFVGFRLDSTDYMSYKGMYQNIYILNNIDFLFAILIKIFKYFNFSFIHFIFFISFISISIKFYYFKKYSPYIYLTLLLYFVFMIHKDLGQIRNALIAAIMLSAIIPLVSRNIILYFAIIFIACGFHVFALVALPLYFLYPILRNKNYTLLITTFSVTIFSIGGLFSYIVPFLQDYDFYVTKKLVMYFYHTKYNQEVVINFNVLFLIISQYILIFLKDSFIKKDSFYEGLYFSFIYSIVIFLCFSDLGIISARVLDFMAYLPLSILIPYIISQIKDNKIKNIVYAFFILFAIIRFIPISQSMEPYKNIFFS